MRLLGVMIAVAILIGAMFASWSIDQRAETVIDEELQAQIEELQEKARQPGASATLATELLSLRAQADEENEIVNSGVDSKGPQLGLWAWIAGLIALGMGFPAFNFYSYNERRLWLWSALTAGFGASAAFIAFAWIATHVRSGDFNFATGVGAFFRTGRRLADRGVCAACFEEDSPHPNL